MTAAQVKELSPPTFHFTALFYSLTQPVAVFLTLQQASKAPFFTASICIFLQPSKVNNQAK